MPESPTTLLARVIACNAALRAPNATEDQIAKQLARLNNICEAAVQLKSFEEAAIALRRALIGLVDAEEEVDLRAMLSELNGGGYDDLASDQRDPCAQAVQTLIDTIWMQPKKGTPE